MDPTPFQRMYDDAKRVSGIQSLAVFAALCMTYADEARKEIGYRVSGPILAPVVRTARNVKPAEAAARLGISVRKLTRGRFTTYREVCIPIEGQTRGYVVSEPALDGLLSRQRRSR